VTEGEGKIAMLHPQKLGRLATWPAAFLLSLGLSFHARANEIIDSPMYRIPYLPEPKMVPTFPRGAKELWLKALERPEADMRLKAAEAITLAHRTGVKGMDTTIKALQEALDKAEEHPAVRLAAAKALVALNARTSAASLWRQAEAGGNDFRDLVEPVMARWDYKPARAVWLERLDKADTRKLVLAIQSLATVRESKAAEPLEKLIMAERTPRAIRLEAARALAILRTEGLEKDAEALAKDAGPRSLVGRIAAVSLLQNHKSKEAIALLEQFRKDSEPAVAALAVGRLLAIDPKLLVGAAETLLDHRDANLRSFGVEVLYRQPTEKHIALLAKVLDDKNPCVREKARRLLQELARQGKWRRLIFAGAMEMLGTRNWRGLEQATILLVQLNHKEAAGRLVELLEFARPEVFITAAWGLRKLAVAESLPGALAYVKEELPRIRALEKRAGRRNVSFSWMDHQLSQLAQFLGQQKYAPADAVLRRFIPRSMKMPHDESRAAAIWALGMLHEGKTDDALVKLFGERLNDTRSMPPEDLRVRRMSAVALGRLKGKALLPSLRLYYREKKPSQDPINNSCGWAIEQITGEKVPAPETVETVDQQWFLVPAK
jgi:hypothetical protein